MASDDTHRRNRRMTTMAAVAFVLMVIGISTHAGWLAALGGGAFVVALLGRLWT